MLRTPNISSQKLRTPPRGCFFVDLAVLCGVCGVLYSNVARFQGETRCAREFDGVCGGVCGVLCSNLARFQGETRCAGDFVVSLRAFSSEFSRTSRFPLNLVRFD